MRIQKKKLPEKLEEALEKIEEDFNQAPLNYLVESALQHHLRNILSDQYSDTVEGEVTTKDVTNYKKPYIEVFEEKNSMDAVQTEVNIGSDGHNDSLIDICVFDPESSPEVTVENGSKYFKKDHIRIAIEVKYVKNDNLLGSVWNNDNAPSNIEELKRMRRKSNSSYQFFKDIEKLSELKSADYRLLLIFNNKNILQQPRDSDTWSMEGIEEEKYSEKATAKMKNLLEILDQEDRDIALREIHLHSEN